MMRTTQSGWYYATTFGFQPNVATGLKSSAVVLRCCLSVVVRNMSVYCDKTAEKWINISAVGVLSLTTKSEGHPVDLGGSKYGGIVLDFAALYLGNGAGAR